MSVKAFIVIDMQEKYLADYDSGLIDRVNSGILRADNSGIPVIYIRNVGKPEDDDIYKMAEGLIIMSDIVYEKKRPSAFTSEEFIFRLRKLNADTLILAGIDGSCCVARTATDAIRNGFKVTIMQEYVGARNERVYGRVLKELTAKGACIL